jgi:hypothetical protein
MKDRASKVEKRPAPRRAMPTRVADCEANLREDGNFMDLDDWTEDEDDIFDDFFPEEVKRR